jgi:hypothetical protein
MVLAGPLKGLNVTNHERNVSMLSSAMALTDLVYVNQHQLQAPDPRARPGRTVHQQSTTMKPDRQPPIVLAATPKAPRKRSVKSGALSFKTMKSTLMKSRRKEQHGRRVPQQPATHTVMCWQTPWCCVGAMI